MVSREGVLVWLETFSLSIFRFNEFLVIFGGNITFWVSK
jgi:hypothetical protein